MLGAAADDVDTHRSIYGLHTGHDQRLLIVTFTRLALGVGWGSRASARRRMRGAEFPPSPPFRAS
jgi:hypothetical protein